MAEVVFKKPLTFVVVYRNEEANLEDLLNSINQSLKTELREKCSFLFINNHSSDQSEEIVKKWIIKNNHDALNVNRDENNMGAARQQSLKMSTTPWISFVDADSILDSDWFENIFSLIESADENVSAIGGCSNYLAQEQWHRFVIPLWNYFPLGKVSGRSAKVFHVPTNNYLLNRDKALSVNGFDSYFNQVGEDLDINVRLNRVGDVYYDPRLIVSHKLPQSVLSWYTKMALYGRAQSAVFLKYRGSVAKEKSIPLLILLLLVYLIVFSPQAAMIIITINLLIERTRFYFLSFLFYGLGELVGFVKTILTLPFYKKTLVRKLIPHQNSKGALKQ